MTVSQGPAHTTIESKAVNAHKTKVDPALKVLNWTPSSRADAAINGGAKKDEDFKFMTHPGTSKKTDQVSIISEIQRITGNAEFLTPDAAIVVDAVRTGFMLGFEVFALYANTSGLEQLVSANAAGKLSDSHVPEFHAKKTTGSFVCLFSAASYIHWKLASYKAEKTSAIEVPIKGIPEVRLDLPNAAVNCVLYYYGWHLKQRDLAKNDLELLKLTLNFFEQLLEELDARMASLSYTEFFANAHYKLEGTDFVIDGFTPTNVVVGSAHEFRKVKFDEIVGNRDAKHHARRLAMRLACYDPIEKRNPWLVLGGFSPISLGYGKPGTGKSLQIAATATMIHEYCQRRGVAFEVAEVKIGGDGTVNFVFWPMPDNLISTFQGGSGERALNWMSRLHDPDKVIYAPVDDAENNLEDRTRQGVSSGVREVIGVFLRHTEGAGAINHGNWAIDIMTNLPEQIDPAVLSRVQTRFAINGAESDIDFVDQNFLWLSGLKKQVPDFVDIPPIPGQGFLETQGSLKSLSDIETGDPDIKNDQIRGIVESVQRDYGIESLQFFGKLYQAVLEVFPAFSSRDVRNIQSAVMARVMDFDCPEDWFDKHALFFAKKFDERVSMLRELMQANVKGLSLPEIQFREAVKYLDNLASIASVTFGRGVEEKLQQAKIRQEAHRRANDPELAKHIY
ncbi:MAG: AAA family ATPase [Candidatus Pacebacteria bacterium]|nr:AAA family ATPase [Candidatus Paceibacterota bacterium]